jgi:ATP-grasp domain-containing protein
MIILEKPYVSSLLKQTVINKKIPVLKNDMLEGIALNGEFNSYLTDDLIEKCKNEIHPLVYSNSENSIEWINKNLAFTSLPETIEKLKNKYTFRQLLEPLYPNLYFKKIKIEDIDKIGSCKFPFIIKPSVGFFSLGIFRVNNQKEWLTVKEELKTEVGNIKNIFPKEVMNLSEFIIEEIIEGEEFAIDMYYKSDGKPVILNIYKHLFSSDYDVSDRSYHTSKEIIEKHIDHFTGVLGQIGRTLNKRQ